MAAVRLVVNLHTHPGKAEEYAQAWQAHADEVEEEPGCLQYELFRSARHPDNLAMLELWADRDAFDAHWALELTRPMVRPELIASAEGRELGRDGLEIYWEQSEQRWSSRRGEWVAR
ncbi:putative quinol monooxygenase [Jatrophihabitans fulvus]